MGAEPDDLAVLEHDDLVGVADRRHPLGDDQDGGIGGARRQRRPQPGVGGQVEGRERVVEHVDLGPGDERPGDRQPLALAARHVGPALGDLAVEPVRHRLHEAGGLGDVERLPQLAVGRVGSTEPEVGRHGAGEQVRLLGDVADLPPEQVGVEVAHVDAVDEHRPVGGVEQSRHQVDERRLAGAGAADDRGRLPGLDPERHVAQHGVLGAGVAEADVAELEGAVLGHLGDRVGRRPDRRLGVEHLDDPLGGDAGARDHRHHERHHHDGHQDLDEVAEVGDERADLQVARVDRVGADPQHRRGWRC